MCAWSNYYNSLYREGVHDALPALRRALRGKIMRLRYIVGGKLVCDPKARAIRSVFLNSNIISKTKNRIHILFVASLDDLYHFFRRNVSHTLTIHPLPRGQEAALLRRIANTRNIAIPLIPNMIR